MRALAPRDLDAVAAIDAELGARPRRAYFERRLRSAQRAPEQHLQLAVDRDGALAGYMLGRALEGEFGRSEPALRLEAFGVKREAQGRGLGAALSREFEGAARSLGASEIRTTAVWREHPLLRFLDHAGYRLSPNLLLDRTVADSNDYDTPRGADSAVLARDELQTNIFSKEDLDGAARIDRRLTGRDRRGYLCRTFGEALADSAVRISLAARVDGGVAGYLMARVDYGDFGRLEPAAVIDTVGVDPLRARQGIGRGLLSQLFVNLRGLGVERVETVVAPDALDLLGFFVRAGFRPSERLSFLKRLS